MNINHVNKHSAIQPQRDQTQCYTMKYSIDFSLRKNSFVNDNIMLSLGVICDTGIYTVKKPIYTEGAVTILSQYDNYIVASIWAVKAHTGTENISCRY